MPITVPNIAAITAAVQTMLNSQKTELDTTINAARDNVKADTTAQLATQKTALDTTINAARDNVKADTTAQLATQTTAINSNTDTKTGAVTTAVNAKGVIKSVQRGVATTTGAITIASVDVAKSFVNVSQSWQNAFGGGGANNQGVSGRARLTSATQLTIETTMAVANLSLAWEVVEYF